MGGIKNTIGIIGQGFVGTAVNEGLAKHYHIRTYDIAKESTDDDLRSLWHTTSDIIFLCLPTPMEKDGKCHLGIIEPVLEELNELGEKIIVIKSTIPPGTTEKWNEKYKNIQIVFNPEFLTEANSIEDFKNQNRIIIGGPRPATTKVRRLYKKAFPRVAIIKTGSTVAEMVKYFTNCFLATKVSFANEMYQICNKLEIDYDKVIEYTQYDSRIGNSHLEVPGPDGDFGYGGHCFPKDVKALIDVTINLGIQPHILMATDNKNNIIRKNRDWEKQKGRAII
jgi:nucleotide sugar dehydrogenase